MWKCVKTYPEHNRKVKRTALVYFIVFILCEMLFSIIIIKRFKHCNILWKSTIRKVIVLLNNHLQWVIWLRIRRHMRSSHLNPILKNVKHLYLDVSPQGLDNFSFQRSVAQWVCAACCKAWLLRHFQFQEFADDTRLEINAFYVVSIAEAKLTCSPRSPCPPPRL